MTKSADNLFALQKEVLTKMRDCGYRTVDEFIVTSPTLYEELENELINVQKKISKKNIQDAKDSLLKRGFDLENREIEVLVKQLGPTELVYRFNKMPGYKEKDFFILHIDWSSKGFKKELFRSLKKLVTFCKEK